MDIKTCTGDRECKNNEPRIYRTRGEREKKKALHKKENKNNRLSVILIVPPG